MSEWISVKERLPDSDLEDVLVWMPEDDFVGTGYFDKSVVNGYIKKDGSFFQTNSGWEVNIPWAQKGPVTHWMPLPNPPKQQP